MTTYYMIAAAINSDNTACQYNQYNQYIHFELISGRYVISDTFIGATPFTREQARIFIKLKLDNTWSVIPYNRHADK
jgi:hypothetical protein